MTAPSRRSQGAGGGSSSSSTPSPRPASPATTAALAAKLDFSSLKVERQYVKRNKNGISIPSENLPQQECSIAGRQSCCEFCRTEMTSRPSRAKNHLGKSPGSNETCRSSLPLPQDKNGHALSEKVLSLSLFILLNYYIRLQLVF